jgi:hypothetical protein
MGHHMPFIQLGFLATVLGVAAGLVTLVYAGARRAHRPAAGRDAFLAGTAIALWLALTAGLAAGDVIHLEQGPQRLMPLALTAVFAPLLMFQSSAGRLIAAAMPPGPVMWLQTFRVPVEIVLWSLAVVGVMPVAMTFAGRNLDLFTGLTAIPVAVAAWGGGRRFGMAAAVWNLGGLVLLVNVASVAVRAMPGPQHSAAIFPANTLVGHAPWIWLPTFLVPAAFWLHAIGLRHARAASRAAVFHSQG